MRRHLSAIALSCLVVLGACARVSANGPSAPVLITSVSAQSLGAQLRVRVQTAGRGPFPFRAFILRDTDRLVIDLEEARWKGGPTTVFSGAQAGVTRVRVAQFTDEPPVVRLVFSLAVPGDRIVYRVASPPGATYLEVQLSPPRAGRVAPAPARVGRPARVAVREPAPPEPLPLPPPPEELEPGAGPLVGEEQPAEAEAPEARPRVAEPLPAAAPRPAPRPRPMARRAGLAAAWAPLLALAAVLAGLGVWRLRMRTREWALQAWLRAGLQSPSGAARLAALEAARSWPEARLRAARDSLLEAARDSHRGVAEGARELLRRAYPLETLLRALARGRRGRRRLDAVRLASMYADEKAAEALLAIAPGAGSEVRQAVTEALAAMLSRRPLRALMLALGGVDPARARVAVEALRIAGSAGAGALKAALSDPHPEVRCGALRGLELSRAEGGVGAAMALLADPAEQVRAQAAATLGRLANGGDVSAALLGALSDPSPRVQQAAALALAEQGGDYLEQLLAALDQRASENPEMALPPEVFQAIASQCSRPGPALARALGSFNRGFASSLARALAQAGALEGWVNQLASLAGEAREHTMAVLRAAGAAGGVEPLVAATAASDGGVREACVALLGEVGDASAVKPLVGSLGDAEERVRLAAARALGQLGGHEALSGLVAAMADPSPAVRAAAAVSLAQAAAVAEAATGARAAAIQRLEEALGDAASEVRAEAARALGMLAASEALPRLLEIALHDPALGARTAAVGALDHMEAHESLPLLMEVVNSPEPDIRARAVQVFARSGSPAAADVLVQALQDQSAEVRATAGRGLWEIASKGHCQVLLPYLKSPDPRVRAAVAGVLGKVQAREYAGALAAAAADPDPRVRASIVNALAKLGEDAGYYLRVVMDRLSDHDGFVRARTLDAMRAMAPGSEDGARRALDHLMDPNPEVREAAAAYLLAAAERGLSEPLLEAIADPERQALVRPGLQDAPEETLWRLLGAAREARPDVGQPTVEALAAIFRARWTASDFEADLRSLEVNERLAALEALALLGTAEARQLICRALAADPAPEVRFRAVEILAHTADAAAEAALHSAAEADPSPRVRDAAASAAAGLWLSEA